jgi:hypothetical protein
MYNELKVLTIGHDSSLINTAKKTKKNVPPKQYPVAANSFTPCALGAFNTLLRVGLVFSSVWFGNQPKKSKVPFSRASAGIGSPL